MLQLELLDGYTVIILNLTKLEKIVTLSFARNKDFTSFGSSKILLKGRGGFPITLLFICYTFFCVKMSIPWTIFRTGGKYINNKSTTFNTYYT